MLQGRNNSGAGRRRFAWALTLLIAGVAGLAPSLAAQQPGAVRGRVVDGATQHPIEGVLVAVTGGRVQDTAAVAQGGEPVRQDVAVRIASITDSAGNFFVPDLPAGVHALSFQRLGYLPLTRTDIAVAPGRTVQLEIELQATALELGALVVSAGFFQRSETQPVSHFSLNAEEIRRAPGSAGDVSRVLQVLPSTAQMMDNANDLFVRGGSPFENGFYIDEIQVPNINHFPTQGATGGPIGMLNVAFIDDVRFSAGGFSARYGDRLSSVTDIRFREGNREEVEFQLDMNMAGFGGSVEGPLPGGSGSWFVSGHRSFLDLVVDAIGTGVAPRYSSVHMKATYDVGVRDRLTLLGIAGKSEIGMAREESVDAGMPSFGDYVAHQGTLGASWRRLWHGDGYSLHVLSASAIASEDAWYRSTTGDLSNASDYLEAALRARSLHRARLGARSSIEFGAEAELTAADYDYSFEARHDRLGNLLPRFEVNDRFDGLRAGAFASHTWTPHRRWELTTGLRADYDDNSESFLLAPRLAASYEAGERLRLNAAAGSFRQRLPSIILSQDEAFADLRLPRALHLIGGADYLLTESTRLTAEAYVKEYDFFPIPLGDPDLFVVDDGTSMRHFSRYADLVDEGEARSYGIELLLQKKLAVDFYGIAGASLFRSLYRGLDGVLRARAYDNRYVLNLVGGYRPSPRWELSARWGLAGGGSYTPFDMELSRELGSGVIDTSRIRSARYPAYHSLNLRFDRHFLLAGSQLTAAAQVWNTYNRKNVAFYYWDEVANEPATYHQWSFVPLVGLEWKW